MAGERQIELLAYRVWEEEGRPQGKDVEHYLPAEHILERGGHSVIELPAATAGEQLQAPK